MESILDIQFEMFTAYLNNGHKTPQRSRVNNANAYIGAPYGIYETKEGYLALAMASIVVLWAFAGVQSNLKSMRIL